MEISDQSNIIQSFTVIACGFCMEDAQYSLRH